MLNTNNGIRLLVILVAGFVISCSRPTFYQQTYNFNKQIAFSHFEAAEKIIEENKDLEKGKLRFLYYVNAGTVEHLKGDFKRSNEYFDKADLFIEDERKKALEEGAAFLLDPNISTYHGEDHEVLLIHYYKALNYYLLGEPTEALVEVRRLNLKLQKLSEKYTSERKYTQDAFMHLLMGIIYEANNDMNNAFIAYRNAYNIYETDYAEFFKLSAPDQLKKDIVRTAALSGLREEQLSFENKFNLKYEKQSHEANMILLWNNGMGPVKEEWGLNFAIIQDSFGWVSFVNRDFGFTFPFYVGDRQFDVAWVKVVFPRYAERPTLFNSATVVSNNMEYPLELAEDINAVSFKVLNERMMMEFSTSLIRVALKQAAANQIGKEADSPELGAALSILASATERADTRNWQTLPHSISYTRIPIKKGDNTIELHLHGATNEVKPLQVDNVRPGETIIYPFYSLGAGEPI